MIFHRRIMGVETEYGISGALSPEDTARYLFRPIVAKYSSTNIFAPNSSRLYLDVGSHPEIATAECDDLRQLLAHEKAGDAMLNDLAIQAEAAQAAEGIDGPIYLFKNNVDSVGNSYGCHENYLIGRSMVLKTLGKQLLPFLITRQLTSGAGMLSPTDGFLVSQRADQVWEGISSATTRSRPVINTRDEPHGDSKKYRRMHVIVGDSNMSEPTFMLKVGSTLLVLEMLEAGLRLPDLELQNSILDLRAIARDRTGRLPLQLKNGGTVTALEIQEIFYEHALQWFSERPDEGVSREDLERVLDLWGRTLTAIRAQDYAAVDTEIDWMIKLKLLRRYADKLGEDHPKLAQVDLAYHDIRPDRGVFHLLTRKGLAATVGVEPELTAPATTRAALRGKFLAAAEETDTPVTVDWTHLKINGAESVELLDPFSTVDERVDELIAAMVG